MYRLRQVRELVAARLSPPGDDAAKRVLPPKLLDIFRRMPPEDRRHGLTVLAELESRGQTALPLLQAALLHDAGKAESGVGLAHRSLRVLFAKRVPGLWRFLISRPTGWRRPFWVMANHPERGAVWIETAGGSPELVLLVRYHEMDALAEWGASPLARWHAALAEVDAGH